MQDFLKSVFPAFFLLSSSFADPIGINFGSGRADASLNSADSAGVIPQTNWNNADGPSGGPLVLNNGAGIATAATLTWSTDEQWSIGGPAADSNGTMLNGWVSANNTDDPPATVTLTGIPFDRYDLLIYTNHDRGTEDVLVQEAGSAFAPFLLHENDTDILAPVTFLEQTLTAEGDPLQSGNYVRFQGLTQSGLELILDPAGSAGTPSRGAITGIQIIEAVVGDNDGDGLDDTWELSFGLDPDDNGLNPNNNGVAGDPDNGADGDPDGDGSTNIDEQTRGTFPNDDDSDNDGLLDGVETNDGNYIDETATGTDPLSMDTDGDGLADGAEDNTGIFVDETMTGTDPNSGDTDGDSLRDDWEIANGLSPFDDGTTDPDNGQSGDPDSDGSDNGSEQTRGTDPQDADSDDDGLADGVETNDGNYLDADNTGTNPLDTDTDGDGLPDGLESNSGVFAGAGDPGSNPNLPDTDSDFFSDGWEVDNGRNPVDGSDNQADAGAIGLNFGSGRADAALFDADVAGIAAQSNWNNLPATLGTAVVLNDDTGADSGATVSWAMDEEWSIGGPALEPNGTLLNGWVSANNAGATNTIDIENIPYGSYDLVVYVNHDRGTEDVLLSEANGVFQPFLGHENDTDILGDVIWSHQGRSAAEDAGQTGNFFVIPNLSSPVLNLLVDPAGDAGSADRGSINAIQLINRGAAPGGLRITEIVPDHVEGTVRLTWNSVEGRTYAIDAGPTPDLTEANEIDDFQAISDVSTYTEIGVDFAANPKRFYRIREVE